MTDWVFPDNFRTAVLAIKDGYKVDTGSPKLMEEIILRLDKLEEQVDVLRGGYGDWK